MLLERLVVYEDEYGTPETAQALAMRLLVAKN